MSLRALAPFGTALALGLLLGFEREWSARKAGGQILGSRTFALLALAGAVAAALHVAVLTAGLLGVATLVALSSVHTRKADRGITTEGAALCAYLPGRWR